MPWNLSNDRPIYLQLVEHIKLQILSGKYSCGEHFPAVRELAAEASVNPNTMQRALVELEQEGLLINERTSGRSVTTDHSMIQNMKEDMANEIFLQFKQSLSKLGFAEEDIREFIMKEYH